MLRFGKWICGAAALLSAALGATAADGGESVVVVYNQNLPESKQLAEHYAQQRGVPAGQLFGVDVSATDESLSRAQFRTRLQEPQ